MTYDEWSVIITSLEFTLQRFADYPYVDPAHRRQSEEPVERVLAKARAARKKAKAAA